MRPELWQTALGTAVLAIVLLAVVAIKSPPPAKEVVRWNPSDPEFLALVRRHERQQSGMARRK